MSRLGLIVLLVMVAATASAQECTIGVYSDPAGTVDGICLPSDGVFFVHVVLHVSDTAASVSYSVDWPWDVFVLGRVSGPNGNGSATDVTAGTSVDLGECASGFGDSPIVVDTYACATIGTIPYDQIVLGPHGDVDPGHPIYVTCEGIAKPCDPGPPFYFGFPMIDCRGGVSTEATGFSAIKGLFGRS